MGSSRCNRLIWTSVFAGEGMSEHVASSSNVHFERPFVVTSKVLFGSGNIYLAWLFILCIL